MPAVKDIRLEVRVRNNLVLRKMDERGIQTVAELCRQLGKPHRQTRVGELINMKEPACNKGGGWSEMALMLAEFFRCLPEDIFSDFQQTEVLEKNRAYAEVEFSDIQQAIAARQTPELSFQHAELVSAINEALGKLTAREERVLRLLFGIDTVESTFEQVGKQLGLTKERVRQIEMKALRKLKHPSYNQKLREASTNDSGFVENY